MLVISRRPDQEIVFHTKDGEFRLKVLRVRSNEVRLGFDAAPEFRIRRGELVERSHDGKEEAPSQKASQKENPNQKTSD